jgi:CRP-like cAMP-binding protein
VRDNSNILSFAAFNQPNSPSENNFKFLLSKNANGRYTIKNYPDGELKLINRSDIDDNTPSFYFVSESEFNSLKEEEKAENSELSVNDVWEIEEL